MSLTAISPLDGRYRPKVQALGEYFSEFALNRYRVMVEVEVFTALLGAVHKDLNRFGPDAFAQLRKIYEEFDAVDAEEIKQIERKTNHDMKAVEYYLKERIRQIPGLASEVEFVHFGLTSEDVSNLAYACMLRDATHDVMIPAVLDVLQAIRDLASRNKTAPMLARTHGQSATPTTLGKEMVVFAHRMLPEISALHRFQLTGKLNGATGTFGSLAIAYPDVDWIAFSEQVIRRLELVPNMITTQIEPHDRIAALCDHFRRINHILLDFDQDMWRYISDGYLRQRVVAGEIGSSAMPHKINPIDFENSEGNLGMANALFVFFGEKLTKSRLQRDLSDSTVLRNLGVAFGHALLAYKSTVQGLRRVESDPERMLQDLDAHPEVLAEAYQTILRAKGHAMPYEALKELTRGQQVTLDSLHAFVRGLDVDAETRDRLLALTPAGYIGLAAQLTERALTDTDELLLHLRYEH
ncbi:Adenylosuccinate lyase [compost metagenome]